MTVHSLVNGTLGVLLRTTDGVPEILHWGSPLDHAPAGDLFDAGLPNAGLAERAPLSLVPEESRGFSGRPGLVGHRRGGMAWSPRFSTQESRITDTSATVVLVDGIAELELLIRIEITDASTLVAQAVLTNVGTDYYLLQNLSLSLPVPARALDVQTFGGRWCNEFQVRRSPFHGVTTVENRSGRTSHERLPAVFAGTASYSESQGEVWGAQLAWSGNFDLRAEVLADGRRHLQLGELLLPGEIALRAGEAYETPEVIATWSERGLTEASQGFHRHLRTQMRSDPPRPRPVILNTWEAVYFDHDLDTLRTLADVAAEVGVERFVLDDGWFGGRRHDRAGLGDWWVSPDVWPDGLHPITSHVTGLGMEFGLWVEPEMVNPDSDLYRLHPEWALTTDGYDPVLGRNQLVLDFGRSDVRQHLLDRIGVLLDTYPISYLKWDMNRVVVQGSGAAGGAGVHAHVLGLYEILDELRSGHPDVAIESCASGGGRVDLGILARTDRVWTSDSNDALDRQLIQRGASMLVPPEVMGAHIGPPVSHTTGRTHSLALRAATAMFGHLGIEWNLLTLTTDERAELAEIVELHKRFRPLLHSGDVVRLDHPDPSVVAHGVVAADRGEAVISVAITGTPGQTAPVPLVIPGLDPASSYDVVPLRVGSEPIARGIRAPDWLDGAAMVTGAGLARHGISLPVMWPETVLLMHVRRND